LVSVTQTISGDLAQGSSTYLRLWDTDAWNKDVTIRRTALLREVMSRSYSGNVDGIEYTVALSMLQCIYASGTKIWT